MGALFDPDAGPMVQPTPQDLVRKIAKGWLALGLLGLLFMAVFIASHFYFGEPIVDRDTGQNMTDGEIIWLDSVMVAGFGLFAFLGSWILRNPEHRLVKQFLRFAMLFAPPWRH